MSSVTKKVICERRVEDLKSFGALKSHNLRMEYAIKALRGCRNFLEIGSGDGFCTRSIQHWSPEAFDSIDGFDIDPKRVQTARALWTNENKIRYQVADAQKTFPYPDKTFDGVVILDVLEHVADPGMVIREAKRVLKAGGTIFVAVPCEGEDGVLHSHLRRNGWSGSVVYGGHIQAFKKIDIVRLLQGEGLDIEWIRYSTHCFGQLTDYFGYEIKRYSDHKRNSSLSVWEKIRFYMIRTSVKIWMQKLSYLESKMLALCPWFAMDLNVSCKKIGDTKPATT